MEIFFLTIFYYVPKFYVYFHVPNVHYVLRTTNVPCVEISPHVVISATEPILPFQIMINLDLFLENLLFSLEFLALTGNTLEKRKLI